jgi:hypothetical protein
VRSDGGITGDFRQPDGLDDPVGELGRRLGLAGEHLPGGVLGVDGVARGSVQADVMRPSVTSKSRAT